MPPRTRSQAARNRSPATAPGSGRSSRYATPTAFDALAVEGASSSESEPESEHEKQHSSPTSAARYGASHLTPAPVRRGGRKASASSEPESATESLKPTNSTAPTDPSLAAAPDAEDVERPQTEDVRRQQEPPLGAADAAASVSGDKNGRIWTSTNYDDQDPNHVHAEAEAVAQAGNHSDPDPESSATASASASSTVNGHTNSKAGETTKSQTAVHARAHASVDTPGEEEKPGKDAERTKVVSTKTEKEVSPAPQPPRVEIPEGEAQVKAKKQADRKAWWTKVYERTVFTFFMIGGFIFLLLLGHPYMILLVMLLATLVYREIVGLFNLAEPAVSGDESPEARAELQQHRKDSLWSKTLSWYFFVVANYFLYGESLVYYFKHIIYEEVYFVRFAKNHRFLSLMLYVFGFMAFILQLRRDNLKRQFGLFSWVHMTLFLIVVSSHFMVNSILEGMIWFWVPASLIICNDIFAYVCGMLFGRTPLISLSPKKTREGFFGAFVITVVFSYFWGSLFQRYNYMICPAVSLGENAWSQMQWGEAITHLPYTLFQLHSLVMASFASLVAPFGGFFASGFKRAFQIKDFGDSIPGHGGLTDRFDCQFLMGLWAYTYYASLIREHHTTVGAVLQVAVTQLKPEEIAELYYDLRHYLEGQGTLKV